MILYVYNLENLHGDLSINYFIQNFILYGTCTIEVHIFFMISGIYFMYRIIICY